MEQVLVANAMGYQGYKVANFLNNQGYYVIGVDRYFQEEKNRANKFFKLDLKYNDSVKLLGEFCKPTVLIFCAEKTQDDYRSVIMLNNIINNINSFGYIILSLDYVPREVNNLEDLVRYNLATILGFSQTDNMIITENDNLL